MGQKNTDTEYPHAFEYDSGSKQTKNETMNTFEIFPNNTVLGNKTINLFIIRVCFFSFVLFILANENVIQYMTVSDISVFFP